MSFKTPFKPQKKPFWSDSRDLLPYGQGYAIEQALFISHNFGSMITKSELQLLIHADSAVFCKLSMVS